MKGKALSLYYYGHPILRKHCELIGEITDEIRQLAADMIATMDKNNGVGISAPQIGRSLRIFVLRNYVEGPNGHFRLSAPMVFINPKLRDPSQQMEIDLEGCLSLPHLRVNVIRPHKITIEATDIEGNIFVQEFEGINARTRMHENDHLNGVLHIDRTDPKTRNEIEPILREMKKKYISPTS